MRSNAARRVSEGIAVRDSELSLAVRNWLALNSCVVDSSAVLSSSSVIRIGRPRLRYGPGWAVAEINPHNSDEMNIAVLEAGLAEAKIREVI